MLGISRIACPRDRGSHNQPLHLVSGGARSIPEIIGVLKTIRAVPEYARGPFSVKFLTGFCLDGSCECTCQI